MSTPSETDRQDLLLGCRFGDLDDVKHFVDAFDNDALNTVHDDNGNSVLHMAAGNGHSDILEYLLSRVDPALLGRRNHAGSTPLHWAAVNRHLDVAKMLVNFVPGPGVDLIDVKNEAGRSPLGEAELAGWEDGARWFVQVMHLGQINESAVENGDGESGVDADQQSPSPSQGIEIEICDADGQMARMAINPDASVIDDTPS